MALSDRVRPLRRGERLTAARRRAGVAAATVAAVVASGAAVVLTAPAASAAVSPCLDGTVPALLDSVSCTSAGNYTLGVPAGTTDIDVEVVGAGGGAGYPARQHIGGNAAQVTGNLTLPAGTSYLYVVVGAGGGGNNNGRGYGGGGSGVLALDVNHDLIAKLAIAGAGGGGAYNGDGGNAGFAGTSENPALAGSGAPAVGAMGGAGGVGNYSNGTAGASNNPGAATIAAGGGAGLGPGGSAGGTGGGGYGGGGGGGAGTQGILNVYAAGGAGGSSLASAYLSGAAIDLRPNTGGVQLPGLIAGDGAVGSVTMTFNGLAMPGAPTNVSAQAGDGEASVSFTAPGSDGGSAITSYTVTASPDGATATCPGSPCTVDGLDNGTPYTFTVHATNDNGDSIESGPSTAVTPARTPGAPTGVSAQAGDGEAEVSFTAPASDGGSSITSYTVTASPDGATETCAGSPCTVGGLDNGTAYSFTVVATNDIGDSPESDASTAVTPVGAPGAPTGVSAAPGDGEAEVSFTAPASDGGSAITSYTVTASPDGATETCAGSPCTVGGLDNGTAYTFTVHATNENGDSPESGASTAVTPATTPGAPTGVSAQPGDREAQVSFTAPAGDGGSAVTSYTVTASPDGATETCAGSPCTVGDLDNGTAYTFTVVATNEVGDSSESDASAAVTPVGVPGAPTGVSAQAGDGEAEVSFTAPAGDGGSSITSYTVTASPDGATETCAGSPCTVGGLDNGTAYTFTVVATNEVGDSPESDASTAVTPATTPGAPTGVSAQPGDGEASVSFAAPAGDGGSAITSYTVTASPGGESETCPGSPCTVTGLDNGTAYSFSVVATNEVGDSLESDASTAVTPVGAPGVPTSVSAQAGNGEAEVSFTAPVDDGGTPVTSYTVTADPGGATATCAGSPCTVGDLDNGTAYTFTVVATNEVGDSAESAASVAVTPATAPGAPTSVSAQAGNGEAQVSFTAPEYDGGAPVTSYTVTADPGGVSATCPGSPCIVGGLRNGTAYTFTVVGTNRTGSSTASTPSTAVTPVGVPGAPTSVSAKAGNRTATVSFAAPRDNGGSPVTSYTVTSSPAGATRTCAGSPCTVTGLRNGTAYRFTVHATNANGDSLRSAPSRAVKPSAPVVKWYRNPLTPEQREKLAPVPANPKRSSGPARPTRAVYRTFDGTLAVPVRKVRGHRLTAGQGVQLTGLFRFDSAQLTPTGRQKLAVVARSLRGVRALTCEGYADYAGSLRNEQRLSTQRAQKVCAVLERRRDLQTRAVGYGPQRPAVIGGTALERGANRRVALLIRR